MQSVVFPGVPHHCGVLRVQINANHRPESIAGLVDSIANLSKFHQFRGRVAVPNEEPLAKAG